MTHLYNCRKMNDDWVITKFDTDLNVLASYHTSHDECECPRGNKPDCRHRKMLKLFLKAGHVDDGWFLEYETRYWTAPMNVILAAETSPATEKLPTTDCERSELPELVHQLHTDLSTEVQVPASPPSGDGRATAIAPAPEGISSPPSGALRIRRISNLMR